MSDDAIISADEVETSRRGRVATYDENLLDLLSKVKPGQAVRLEGTYGQVEKADRQKIGADIRKHWAEVHDTKPRVDFSPEGVPQVQHR